MTAERVTYIENTHEDVKWFSPRLGWYTKVEAFIIRDNGEIRPLPPQPKNSHLVCEINDGDVPVTPFVVYPFSPEEPVISFTCDDETLVFQDDELVVRYDETGLDTVGGARCVPRGVPDGRSPVRSVFRRGRARRRHVEGHGGGV